MRRQRLMLGAGAARLFAALAAIWSMGCSEPVPEEPPALLTLRFSHEIGGAPVAIGGVYTTRYNHVVVFDEVRYWVSHVALGREGERSTAPASYFLVEQTKEREALSLTAQGIAPGTYDTLVFHVGVDPSHNKGFDSAEGELAPGLGMDWGDQGGYKFFRTEGTFTQGELAGEFSFHVGSDVLYKELSAPLDAPLEITAGEEVELSIVGELDRIFAGIPLDTSAVIRGGPVDSPAAQVAGNYSRMFRLESGAPFSARSPNVEGVVGDGSIPKDSTPPVLSEAVIAFGEGLMCSAVPDRPAEAERACVTPFLLDAGGGATYDAGMWTFVTGNGEPVYAASAGVVSDVVYIEHSMLTHSDLFTVAIRPNKGSAFWVEYRNVKDLKVSEGDTVAAGQALGGAGDYFHEDVGLVAFGVRRSQEMTQRLCPSRFATEEVIEAVGAALGASNKAWPALSRDDLCGAVSLLCTGGKCDSPADFVEAPGDIDEGRRIYKDGCASCHGDAGQGEIAPALCSGGVCGCATCGDHATLAARIEKDMPPEGHCDARCAADVAAFLRMVLGAK